MAERLVAAATLRAAAPSGPSPAGRRAGPSSSAFFPSSSSSSPALRLVSLRTASSRPSQKARSTGRGRSVRCMATASDAAQLKAAREDIRELLKTTHCHPILVRLGWHDSGTYDKNVKDWPERGGANGSLRFDVELKHGANAQLRSDLSPMYLYTLELIYDTVFKPNFLSFLNLVPGSWWPKDSMKYGRVDVTGPEQCPPEGSFLVVFYRMGLDDKVCGWKPETKYTKNGPGAPGGQSWTAEWLKFDNSYFKEIKEKRDQDLLVLPTDAALFEDPAFKVYAEKYAAVEEAFFKDYAEAHAKLSSVGAEFDPAEGFSLDD
ncbi:hypothetical protein ZWY2020_025891 [Hordeum vulgare]|nr:hypothetical protein ZWY2020_025891 [Hordeum vulgare]